jgi:hypothetical protein
VTDAEAARGDIDVAPLELVNLADSHPRLLEDAQGQSPARRSVHDDRLYLLARWWLDDRLLLSRQSDAPLPSRVRLDSGVIEDLPQRAQVLAWRGDRPGASPPVHGSGRERLRESGSPTSSLLERGTPTSSLLERGAGVEPAFAAYGTAVLTVGPSPPFVLRTVALSVAVFPSPETAAEGPLTVPP